MLLRFASWLQNTPPRHNLLVLLGSWLVTPVMPHGAHAAILLFNDGTNAMLAFETDSACGSMVLPIISVRPGGTRFLRSTSAKMNHKRRYSTALPKAKKLQLRKSRQVTPSKLP